MKVSWLVPRYEWVEDTFGGSNRPTGRVDEFHGIVHGFVVDSGVTYGIIQSGDSLIRVPIDDLIVEF